MYFGHYGKLFYSVEKVGPLKLIGTPANEPPHDSGSGSYICATFSARYGCWNEQLSNDRPFVTALKHIVRANVMAMRRYWRCAQTQSSSRANLPNISMPKCLLRSAPRRSWTRSIFCHS